MDKVLLTQIRDIIDKSSYSELIRLKLDLQELLAYVVERQYRLLQEGFTEVL